MKSAEDREGKEREGAERMLQALFEKDRLGYLGLFVQGLIHNINGPLQNMSMLVEIFEKNMENQDLLIREQCPEFYEKWKPVHEKQMKRCEQLEQQIVSLADMMRDFMTIHELEHSGTEIDLNLVLSKLTRVFRADLFFKHQVKFDLRLSRNLPLVCIPGRDFVPAIMHLFRNALAALRGASRKELIVESRHDGGMILVFIEDTGCGFDSCEDTDALFDLFSTRWPARDAELGREERHLGFGLYAARRLLEPYGATIRLEQRPNGACSIMEIPVQTR